MPRKLFFCGSRQNFMHYIMLQAPEDIHRGDMHHIHSYDKSLGIIPTANDLIKLGHDADKGQFQAYLRLRQVMYRAA